LSSPAANRRGILAMLVSMTLFTLSDTVLKVAAATQPPGEIMAVRGIFAVLITLCFMAGTKQLAAAPRVLSWPVVKRALLEVIVSFLFITCLAVLALGNLTAIVQSTPIILTVIAVVLGLERVGWRRWGAILAGFTGVIMIIKPTPAGFDVYALIAVLTAVLISWRDLVTRTIGPEVPSIVITLSTTFAVMVAGFVIGLAEDWVPLGVSDVALLVVAALLVTLGNLGVVMAFRDTDVSVVAPFRYSNVPLAILLGAVVFGDFPDAWALAGIIMIVASGIYTMHRERVRRAVAAEKA
jgi:drug/metabolite transporter (DMT)-like permease